jgi:hypothetical protein
MAVTPTLGALEEKIERAAVNYVDRQRPSVV